MLPVTWCCKKRFSSVAWLKTAGFLSVSTDFDQRITETRQKTAKYN
jgi:hypothetical protein